MEDKEKLKFVLSVLKNVPHSINNQWFWNEIFKLNEAISINEKQDNSDWLVKYFKIDIPRDQLFDYTFIENEKLRNELIIDNINMIRARYGKLNHQGKVDFDEYIRFSHYQIEGLLSLFFSKLHIKEPTELSNLYLETRISVKIIKDHENFYRSDSFKTDGGLLVYFNKLMKSHKDIYKENALKQVPDFDKFIEFSKMYEFLYWGFYIKENTESIIKKIDTDIIKFVNWTRNRDSHRNTSNQSKIKEVDKIKYDDFIFKKDFNAIYETLNYLVSYIKLKIKE